jgi:hypothetical protein
MRAPIVVYDGKPQPHSWCKWAINRIKNKNNSTNIRFIGDTGSGKSWSALSIAEIMAGMMGMKIEESDIYFSISDVIRKVYAEDPKPGTIFFIDEQQIEGASGEYNNLRGKAYTAFFSTCRSRRYIIISTMPFADMIIKKVRRFFHLEIETMSVNTGDKVVLTKPRLLDYHKHKEKIYRKMLIMKVRDKNSGLVKSTKISVWNIPKPSDEMIDIYERKKAEFQHQTYGKLVDDLNKFDNMHKDPDTIVVDSPGERVMESLTPFQKDLFEVMSAEPHMSYKDMSEKLIERGYNCTGAKISSNLKFMKNKGVVILKRRKRKDWTQI